jgi:hypothetical protein
MPIEPVNDSAMVTSYIVERARAAKRWSKCSPSASRERLGRQGANVVPAGV